MELNKRGQGLSVNAIILIILGVVVLAVLIFGFTVGWQKITPFISTNNVDTIVTDCSVACVTSSQYDFCTSKRDLKAEDVELEGVTCNYLAEQESVYGVEPCGAVSCDGISFAVNSLADAGTKCSETDDNGNFLHNNTVFQYLENSELVSSPKCVGGVLTQS